MAPLLSSFPGPAMTLRLFRILLCSTLLAAVPVNAQNLLSNGDFEAGLTGWTIWSAPVGFWDDNWLHTNDCDIWVPTNGCPYAGTTSHAQKKGSGSGNTLGGIYQTISVVAGQTYQVSGQWSGGVHANTTGNGTFWRVEVYDGVPTEAQMDAGPTPQDTLIALKEENDLPPGSNSQFQWESFAGSFTAPSDTVTLVLKAGSYYTFEAAAYHDNLVVEELGPPAPVPALPLAALGALAGLLALFGIHARRHAPK